MTGGREVLWVGALAVVGALMLGNPAVASAKKNSVKGSVQGRYKSFAKVTTCAIVGFGNGMVFLNVGSTSKPKVNIRKRSTSFKFMQFGGAGPDPTAAGATFPIELTDDEMGFVDVRNVSLGTDPESVPGWVAQRGESFAITITGYEKGRIKGTVVGTLQPGDDNSNGPIDANLKFNLSCTVQ